MSDQDRIKAKHDYAMDYRTVEQYERDLSIGLSFEEDTLRRYANYCKDNFNHDITWERYGTAHAKMNEDFTADYDYLINGKPVEIKVNRNNAHQFGMKVNNIDKYIDQKAYLLIVNGYTTKNPVFTLISPKQMKQLTRIYPASYHPWWGKLVYPFEKRHFKWIPLPK